MGNPSEFLEITIKKNFVSFSSEEQGIGKIASNVSFKYGKEFYFNFLIYDRDGNFSTKFIYDKLKKQGYNQNDELIRKIDGYPHTIYECLIPLKIMGGNKFFISEKEKEEILKDFNMQTENEEDKQANLNLLLSGSRDKKNHFYSTDFFDDRKRFITYFREDFTIMGFFDGEIQLNQSIFQKKFGIQHFIKVDGGISAEYCSFLDDIDFSLWLPNGKVTNLSFANSCFEKNVDFSRMHFYGTSNFYGSTFRICPNFAQSVFYGELKLVNTNLIANFDDTYAEIIKAWKKNQIVDTKPKYFVANDFRDSFRLFKNALSKEGNVIDASNYHRVELYCKEIELDSKPDKKPQDKIDKWQLWFYRQTSEHHTDLLRSFHTLIALIGIFGFLCGSVVLGLDYFVFDYQKGFDILQLKDFFFDNIKNSITSHLLEYFMGNVVLVFVFLGLFFGVMWECSREILIPLGYIATFGFLATSPKYLIPAMSLFGEKWVALNPLGTIGGTYTLLFGFLAYSFIKTARKNSIVPS